jgi:D-mannonate dehydratase
MKNYPGFVHFKWYLYSSGQANVTLIHTSCAQQVVEVKCKNFNAVKDFTGTRLKVRKITGLEAYSGS